MIRSKIDYVFYTKADRIISGRENKFVGLFFAPLFLDPVGKFMYLLRSVEYYNNCRTDFAGKIILKYYNYRFKSISIKLGFSIPINIFGPGLYIPHYGTIVINKNCIVGANCVLHTSVCIAGSEKKVIGDNAYFSTGVIVAGNVVLADNISISANSFVNKSFSQKNVLIGGSPAKILKNRLEWFKEDSDIFNNRIFEIENIKRSLNS